MDRHRKLIASRLLRWNHYEPYAGERAYAVANPPNQVKVTSQPIASTATALAGIGDAGALFQIDVLIPVQQGNALNSGYIQPYVSSKSRGLTKVPLTQVFFIANHRGSLSRAFARRAG